MQDQTTPPDTRPDLDQVVAGTGWRVRRPRDRDAEQLVALVGAAFAEYPGCVLDLDDLDADLLAWASHLDELDGRGWLVVDAEDRVLACVGAAPLEDGTVELKRLYVAAAARRRGLGAALVATVERWARARGAERVVLWSDTRFGAAHRLYTRLGYRDTADRRQLHDPSDTTEVEFVRELPDGRGAAAT